jgi:hypothetical protein
MVFFLNKWRGQQQKRLSGCFRICIDTGGTGSLKAKKRAEQDFRLPALPLL